MIHREAEKHKDKLKEFGIAPELIQAFKSDLERYRQIVAVPRFKISMGKEVTQRMKNLFQKTSFLIRKEIDPLMLQFRNTSFYDSYHNARKVIHLGQRSSAKPKINVV